MKRQEVFYIHRPGILTTFQDLGRPGYQRFGVPVSGAMDAFALQVANILVGNQRDEACLEITLVGPELEVCVPITAAITGANLQPMVNGKPICMWKSVQMNKGDRLTFGRHHSGVRSYLSIKGGFDEIEILGSKSVDLNSGFGRMIAKGDRIFGFPAVNHRGIGLPPNYIPTYESSIIANVIEGPHEQNFIQEERRNFFQTTFTVGANSNRMGYRLQADNFRMTSQGDIWSDAVPYGGIQIPPNGQPIVLMADRQTTGGYPRIGTVISTDLPKIAQLPPTGKVHFQTISVEQAQRRAIEVESFLFCLEKFRNAF